MISAAGAKPAPLQKAQPGIQQIGCSSPPRFPLHPAGLSRPSSCAAATFRAWYPRPPAQSPTSGYTTSKTRRRKPQGTPSSTRRLEAAVKPLPAFFSVPVKSESLYEKASERCPVCERMTRLEKDSSSPSTTTLHSCLAHSPGLLRGRDGPIRPVCT